MKITELAQNVRGEQLIALRKALLKPGSRYKFRELKELTGLKTDEALTGLIGELRQSGMKIIHSRMDRTYFLSTVPTPYSDFFDMSWLPKSGRIGVISDTHLCSEADRLDLLEHVYDIYVKEGITTVLHPGDIMDGWQVYRGHEQHVKLVGGAAQARYCVDKYPSRPSIKTYFISGNHDNKSYEKTGIDQCSLVVNGFDYNGKFVEGRKDMIYLGQYSRFLLFPEEATVQLLHPHGANTYAKSYAQQKRAREMKVDTRPNLQISGHMHILNFTKEDITWMLACPGVQDETEYFIRQGYRRDMGYTILEYEARKGRFTRMKPDCVEVG